MSKHSSKIARAAHIKQNTQGTSNEVSLSVLDAIKSELDGTKRDVDVHKPGRIPLFTLPGRRKRTGVPEKERGLPLPGGGFASSEGAPQKSSRLGGIQLESSDEVTGSKAPKGRPRIVGGFPWARAFGTAKPREPRASRTSHAAPRASRTPEEEIAWRKSRRRAGKAMAVATVCLMSVALAGGALWYGIRQYEVQQGNRADLDAALSLIEEADEPVLALDEVVDDPVSAVVVSSTGSSAGSADIVRTSQEGADVSALSIGEKRITVDASDLMKRRSDAVSAQQLLDDADKKARSASLGLADATDKEAANQAVVAIAARKAMVDQALLVSEPAQRVAECAEAANEAWSKVIEGDKLARESAALLESATEEDLLASKEKSEQAQSLFDQARSLFEQARYLYEEADFSPFVAYVSKRSEAMGYAIASDVALLERNKEEAASQNDAYAACDAEAVKLAEQLPENPSKAVREAYERAVAAPREAYGTARMQAGTADAILRDYLGAQGK